MRVDIADKLVWDWLEKQLDTQILERGIDAMAKRKENEAEPTRQRLQQVNDLLKRIDTRIDRLVGDLSDEDDSEVRAAVKVRVKEATQQKAGLIKECDTLTQRLHDTQITPETKRAIIETVAEARKRLNGATFKQKRFILAKLDTRVQLRQSESGRWLDVTCGIKTEGEALPIDYQRS